MGRRQIRGSTRVRLRYGAHPLLRRTGRAIVSLAVDYYERVLVVLREQGDHERAARTWMQLGLTYHNAHDSSQVFTLPRKSHI